MRHPGSFRLQLRRLRNAQGFSVRDLARNSGVEFSLISKIENGQRSAGPVTVEKLANALQLAGDVRDAFIHAGCDQSSRLAQVFGPRMASPTFRSIFSDLLKTLKIPGEMVALEAGDDADTVRYDAVITMKEGFKIGLEFKRGKVLVAMATDAESLPPPTEKSVIASGGFIADIIFRRQ
jgi:transcriptional regulator with XRE-family HTH domain